MADDRDRIGKVIDMAAARGEANSISWLGRLARTEKGAFQATLANAMIILANDPVMRGMLGYNCFTSQHLLMRAAPAAEDGGFLLPGPYPRPWENEDVALVQGYLQRVWSPKFSSATVQDAMLAEAAVRRFHPVGDWLATLSWDGKRRLDHWLVNTFACPNTAFNCAAGAKFMIAAVRRIREPGVKFDHLLVLEGAQGIGKSRACRELFGAPWFSDAMPPDLTSRDAAMALLGIWCLEFAEIEHLIRHEVETIKAFLSRSVDRYRPPYGRAYIERPRQCVLVGTTNSSDYLRDSTGNRRIWPVKCEAADPEWVKVNRDELWAEAAFREARGEAIWLDDAEILSAATEAQAERMAEDVWEDTILAWLPCRAEVRISEVLSACLNIPKERQGKREQMRVAAILTGAGWTRWQYRPNGKGKLIRAWFAPDRQPQTGPPAGQQEMGV